MNVTKPIELLKDAVMGRGPDCMEAPPDAIEQNDEVLGEVPEELQQIYAQAHFRSSFVWKALRGIRPEKYVQTGANGLFADMADVGAQTEVASILRELVWQGIKSHGSACKVEGEILIRQGWKVCRNKQASIVFDSPMFPDNHIVRTFYRVYRKILAGETVLDSELPLSPLGPGQVVVGEISDNAFRQMHMMHLKLAAAIQKFDPYPTRFHEHAAYRDESASTYFRFVGRQRMLTETLSVTERTSRLFTASCVSPEAIPAEFEGKMVGFGVAEGWRIFAEVAK